MAVDPWANIGDPAAIVGGGGPLPPSAPIPTGFDPRSGVAQGPGPADLVATAQGGNLEYLMARLGQYEVPMMNVSRAQQQAQVDQFTRNLALQQARMNQIDLPMLQVQQDNQRLATTTEQAAEDYRNRALGLQGSIQRGQLALTGAQQAAQEALGREGLAQSAYTSADAMNLARIASARSGYQTAEDLTRQNAALGLTADQQAEAAMLARETLAANTAGQQAQQGIQIGQLEGSLRGPRNAFAQQNVNYGLNAAGLSNSFDALTRGSPVAAFQGPQAGAQRATLQTMAQDMAAAGGRPSGPTPWDVQNRIAQSNAFDPIGVGTQQMLGLADRYFQNPGSANIAGISGLARADAANPQSAAYQGLMTNAQRNLAMEYGTPSSTINTQIAAVNAPEASPVSPHDMIRGSGQSLVNAYNAYVQNDPNHAAPPPDKLQAMVRDQFGMTDAEARAMIQKNANWFVNGLGVISPQRMELEAQNIKQSFQQAGMQTPSGVAQRGANNYSDYLSSNKLPGLAANDPRMIDLIAQTYGVDRATAQGMAEQNAAYYRSTGNPIPVNQVGTNIAKYGGGGPSGPPTQQDPGVQAQAAYDAYGRANQEFGTNYLSADDPRWQTRLGDATRLPSQGVGAVAQYGSDYYNQHGQPAPMGAMQDAIMRARAQYGDAAPMTSAWGPAGPSPGSPPSAPRWLRPNAGLGAGPTAGFGRELQAAFNPMAA